jgi:GTP-binding protein Era
MEIKIFKNFFKRIFSNLFKNKKEIKMGFYGPPNAGKTSLANRICKDFTGEEIGTVSKVPHETRKVQFKEKVEIDYKGKKMVFKMIDTPGIATKIDYEDFLKYKLSKKEAKERAKEATQGVIESIKWLDDMNMVVVVLDATENPYNQVNITIIGNLVARKIPVLIVANKIDMKKADIKKIEAAFPEYDEIGRASCRERVYSYV